MNLIETIDKNNIPKHIAIIMDGNGRWAKQQGNAREYGHEHGVESVRSVVEGAGQAGVDYLTLYAFSTENWNRPESEVKALMKLLVFAITSELDNLNEKNVRLMAIGDLKSLPEETQENLQDAIDQTANNSGLTLVLALSYSGRWELVEAAKTIAQQAKDGTLDPDSITEENFNRFLSTKEIPDPEMLIRTSGECRLSNFLLWQMAYCEFFFSDILWPDFRKDHLWELILQYQKRERRFGKTSEQIKI